MMHYMTGSPTQLSDQSRVRSIKMPRKLPTDAVAGMEWVQELVVVDEVEDVPKHLETVGLGSWELHAELPSQKHGRIQLKITKLLFISNKDSFNIL